MRYARWLVCLLVLAAVLLSWLLPRQQIAPVDISFADTEPVPGYEPDRRETPLKIAMISVLNHQDTARYQKELAEGLGRLLDRPVLLLRRKSYMEINQLLSKGDADIGLLSTGELQLVILIAKIEDNTGLSGIRYKLLIKSHIPCRKTHHRSLAGCRICVFFA